MRLSSILAPGCVVLDVGTGSKRDLLERLLAPILTRRPDLDGDAILEELTRREAESSTAIADGIAIPHARPDLSEPVAGFGRSVSGVDFDSLDGKPTRLLFVLLSPRSDSTMHVGWLAHVARVLADANTRRRLLEAGTSEQILDVLHERELELEAAAQAASKGAS